MLKVIAINLTTLSTLGVKKNMKVTQYQLNIMIMKKLNMLHVTAIL